MPVETKFAFALLLLLLPSACSTPRPALTPPAGSTEPAPVDAMAATLEEWRARTQCSQEADGDCIAQFTAWSEIDTAPLRRLFPAYRFFTIKWDQGPVDATKTMTRSYAIGLGTTLAVARDTHSVTEFFHYGNHEAFGEFLRRERIRISGDAAARLVWDAWCDIHDKRWRQQGIERINPSVWHLGIVTIDQVRYYYEVVIDADGLVQSADLHSDRV
jgi:hypothetical protein